MEALLAQRELDARQQHRINQLDALEKATQKSIQKAADKERRKTDGTDSYTAMWVIFWLIIGVPILIFIFGANGNS